MALTQAELLVSDFGFYGEPVNFVTTVNPQPEPNTFGFFDQVPWFHTVGEAPPPFFVQCVVFT